MRHLLARFWAAVDDERVALIQYIFGAVFILAGLYGILAAHCDPPLTLRGSMGGMDVTIWYWLNILGPLTCIIGKAMRGGLTYAGMWLQLTGDVMLAMSLLAYVTGTIQTESWGKGAYGAFIGTGLCFVAALTVTRDVRRLRKVERRLK